MPSFRAVSSVSSRSRHISKARCRLYGVPFPASIIRFNTSVSSCPSAVRHPITRASAPALEKASACRVRISISSSLYRKSPNRGRRSTWIGILIFSRILSYKASEGVVPPTIRSPHNSMRSAPPSSAFTADSTESTQTSRII